MTHINAQQLAFILEIKKEDARAKMCVAWAKSNGVGNTACRDEKGKLRDDFPLSMDVEMLGKELNLPTLQDSVNDITNNFLKRPASKKWILSDFPEKQLKKCEETGKPRKLMIPPGLRSMLNASDIEHIKNEWKQRYNKVIV